MPKTMTGSQRCRRQHTTKRENQRIEREACLAHCPARPSQPQWREPTAEQL